MSQIIPVILSGGVGSRLWPLSRAMHPKQLQKVFSGKTMVQETALRWQGQPIVICNQDHRFLVAEQLREVEIEPFRVVIEPVGRSTAPAVAVAALLAQPDDLLLVMPSDHSVRDLSAFHDAVGHATDLARAGRLVTFGISPTSPNTGYGYIRQGAALGQGFAVDRFVEKPDLETAQAYVQSGQYFWNSGIFLFSAGAYLAELERHDPQMVALCRQSLDQGQQDLFFFRLADVPFAAIKGDSIDYAVMEKTERAAMVTAQMGWSDVGSWSALWAETDKDADGNVLSGDVLVLDSQDCYVRSDHHLVTTIGLKNVVVVATDDAVLVADAGQDQKVKEIVQSLEQAGRAEAHMGTQSWRPWGWYQTVDEGPRHRVKHIMVKPGQRLSLQKHWHRSEHWVVVSGTALVTRDRESFVLRENESTFIPAGTVHRLENPGKVPLRMIEVQSGEYVGEDDIVRLEDSYGR